MREVNDKARMWLSYGVRLVWVVHPDTHTVDVHHQEHSVSTLTEEDALDGMDVLTGFSCAIADLFPD
jgi:Uma2 family endonuclease